MSEEIKTFKVYAESRDIHSFRVQAKTEEEAKEKVLEFGDDCSNGVELIEVDSREFDITECIEEK